MPGNDGTAGLRIGEENPVVLDVDGFVRKPRHVDNKPLFQERRERRCVVHKRVPLLLAVIPILGRLC